MHIDYFVDFSLYLLKNCVGSLLYNFANTFCSSFIGKIVFAAPSRPLVMQQIEACHKIVGIPQVGP